MKIDSSEALLRNTIDSSMDMIQVFKAVRNEQNELIDFIWILNNKAAEAIYGDVIGKSLLTLNPGVVEEGIFDTFKKWLRRASQTKVSGIMCMSNLMAGSISRP